MTAIFLTILSLLSGYGALTMASAAGKADERVANKAPDIDPRATNKDIKEYAAVMSIVLCIISVTLALLV